MKVYTLKRQQHIKGTMEKVWDFFSTPDNLAVLTPPYMNFTVTSDTISKDIYPGQIITYKVSPVLGIPLFWMTEITHVLPYKLFVDEQRRGPYKLWHHQHHFEEAEGGILMTDVVHYQLPFYILGQIAHIVFIKNQLENIFKFRNKKIDEIFNC